VAKINAWARAHSQNIDFVVVYIAEAHASDAWPLGHFVDIPNHTCQADRNQALSLLRSKFFLDSSIPIFADTMENHFDKEFAVWPERCYISIDGVLQYVAMPNHEFGYDRDEFANALSSSALTVSLRSSETLKAETGPSVAEVSVSEAKA